MMLVACPHCGHRDAAEFRASGAPAARPDPNQVTPERWRSYLYSQPNPAGWATELWLHAAGCRRYLIVERNTVTGDVRAVHPGH